MSIILLFQYEEHTFPHLDEDEVLLSNSRSSKKNCKEKNNLNDQDNNFYTTKQLKLHAAAIELISDATRSNSIMIQGYSFVYTLAGVLSLLITKIPNVGGVGHD